MQVEESCRGAKVRPAILLVVIRDPTAMLELVRLVLATLVAAVRSRQRLVVENLLLRQQEQVALGWGTGTDATHVLPPPR